MQFYAVKHEIKQETSQLEIQENPANCDEVSDAGTDLYGSPATGTGVYGSPASGSGTYGSPGTVVFAPSSTGTGVYGTPAQGTVLYGTAGTETGEYTCMKEEKLSDESLQYIGLDSREIHDLAINSQIKPEIKIEEQLQVFS